MLKIKKQINLLYITSILGNLSITGAWVAILAARGFSLVEIGLAETVFHITSLIFEIPSGMLADMYGRKKMLLVSHIMAMIGNMIMVFSGGLGLVCLSFVFHALTYNFASGSGDALAYDSLKSVNQEARYEKYSSNQMIIYRVGTAISTLCAGTALFMGYQMAYLISALTHVVTFLVTCGLVEVKEEEGVYIKAEETSRNVEEDRLLLTNLRRERSIDNHVLTQLLKELARYFINSLLFLKNNPKAAKLMFANSFVGAVDILLLFFLQAKLSLAGLPDWGLGIALFLMEMGGIAGAKLILKVKRVQYKVIFVFCASIVVLGVFFEHSGMVPVMVLGGFLSAMADDALQIRTDARLQDLFPSKERATLISISSFTFSVIMIVLSPLAGHFFTMW